MYIAPNTDIFILKNVPLEMSYENTIFFRNATAQYTYFLGKRKYNVAANYYQRENRNYIRVGLTTENLYDCNYLMFRNTSFENKWFYAFIRKINYLNNSVTEIEYQIDYMQTWFFDHKLLQSYVDRMHTITDVAGDKIVPEDLEAGNEYVVHYLKRFECNPTKVCVLATTKPDGSKPDAGPLNGVYMPLHMHTGNVVADLEFIDYVNSYIENGREDAIVAIYQYPGFMGNNYYWNTTYKFPTTVSTNGGFYYGNASGSYSPKNNKLYTYPYNILEVENTQGQTATFAFENWRSDQIGQFAIYGSRVGNPEVICAPEGYLSDPGYGIGNRESNYEYALTMSNFPICAWNGDVFKAWWAQNKATVTISQQASIMSSYVNAAGGVLSGIGSAFTGNPVGGIFGATQNAIQGAINIKSNIDLLNARKQDLKSVPPQAHGQTQTTTLKAAMGTYAFVFRQKRIKGEYAKIIDDYFTKYGYAIHAIEKPVRDARPHWTYIKTVGAVVTGNFGNDALEEIKRIYDEGITFWNNGDEIGNYSLDNAPSNSYVPIDNQEG